MILNKILKKLFGVNKPYVEYAKPLLSNDGYLDLHENAKKEKCYYIQYPIKIKLPDDKIVEVSSKKEQSQILKEWYKKNPDIKVKSTYIYPITVNVFIDDKTMDEYDEYDLNSDDEFGELKERCKQSSD